MRRQRQRRQQLPCSPRHAPLKNPQHVLSIPRLVKYGYKRPRQTRRWPQSCPSPISCRCLLSPHHRQSSLVHPQKNALQTVSISPSNRHEVRSHPLRPGRCLTNALYRPYPEVQLETRRTLPMHRTMRPPLPLATGYTRPRLSSLKQSCGNSLHLLKTSHRLCLASSRYITQSTSELGQ